MNRLAGSIAFGAAARAVWLIAKDPQSPERRLMVSLKANLSREAKGLAFQISENAKGRPVVAWEPDPVEITADDVLGRLREHGGNRRRSASTCNLLRDMLADGPKPTKDVYAAARQRDISETTIDRARKRLAVKPDKLGFDGAWFLAPCHENVGGERGGAKAATDAEGRHDAAAWRRSSKPNGEKDFTEAAKLPGMAARHRPTARSSERMQPSLLLETLNRRGIRLIAEGAVLAAEPASALSDNDRAAIRRHKPELLRLLSGERDGSDESRHKCEDAPSSRQPTPASR